MSATLIKRGSVKDIYEENNCFVFQFSDRYSLFDWGQMPDTIPGKGMAMAYMAKYFFEFLEKAGIKTHFLEHDENKIKVKKFNVLKPVLSNKSYHYHAYYSRPCNTLIPLEVIFRWGAGKGSSLLKRLENDEELKRQWLIDDTHKLNAQDLFDIPLIDFSTKLEKFDRYVTHNEAKRIAGLTEHEFQNLVSITINIAKMLKKIFTDLGMILWDGKVEFAFGESYLTSNGNMEREIILVDSIGLDELRVEYGEKLLSKEFLRDFYRSSDWYYHWDLTKKNFSSNSLDVSKSNCLVRPLSLPKNVIEISKSIYCSVVNELSSYFGFTRIFDLEYNKISLQNLFLAYEKSLKRIVILGKGARESALALKLSQSPLVHEVIVCPGSKGLKGQYLKVSVLDDLEILNLDNIVQLKPDLVIIGPEDLLALGVADYFLEKNIPVIGPTKNAAQLETSKIFCKEIFNRANVPTAFYKVVNSFDEACDIISSWNISNGLVIKVDGLCQGKGVVVCNDKSHAKDSARSFFDGTYLGYRVDKLIIEEQLFGPEVSAFAICDGSNFKFLGSATDFKRLLNDDLGPNTGGMGAISPSPILDQHDIELLVTTYIPNLLKVMKDNGTPYCGFLFMGIMKTSKGLYFLEINARLGDPETQALLPLIESDLIPYFISVQNQQLDKLPDLKMRKFNSAHVVMCSKGYPGINGQEIQTGEIFSNNKPYPLSYIFPSNCKKIDDLTFVSTGGRVMGVTSLAPTLERAIKSAYLNVDKMKFQNAYFRTDIGRKFL